MDTTTNPAAFRSASARQGASTRRVKVAAAAAGIQVRSAVRGQFHLNSAGDAQALATLLVEQGVPAQVFGFDNCWVQA